jgi:hypothetical protein
MQPLRVSFPLEWAKEELEKVGCYLLETFSDGMTRWGNDSDVAPFTGSSAIADTQDGDMSLTQITYVLNRVDRAGHYQLVEERLRARSGKEDHGKGKA